MGSAVKPSTATVNGITLELDHNIMSDTMLKVIRSGRYEFSEAREIPRIVQPGERIIELGSGIGFIAMTALKTGRVVSYTGFEANPKLIPVIERNAALNDLTFDIHNAIVAPSPLTAETAPFYLRQDFWASSMSPQPWGYTEKVDVPLVAFDEIVNRYRPTMLIVDIEGGEEALFSGVALTGIKKIYMELHQNVVGRVGMKRIFDFMSSRDFHYDQHHSHGGVVLFSHVLR